MIQPGILLPKSAIWRPPVDSADMISPGRSVKDFLTFSWSPESPVSASHSVLATSTMPLKAVSTSCHTPLKKPLIMAQ